MTFKLKIDKRAFGDLFLRSDGVRDLVSQVTAEVAERVEGNVTFWPDEIVIQPREGKTRARGYVTRLGSGLVGEAEDGALTKGLG